jgi:hypothetical protein
MDDSFAQWYPIDWGFNPFDVESFVKETMLNHFVRGRVKQKEIKDGDSLTTLGGKTLTFTFSSTGNLRHFHISRAHIQIFKNENFQFKSSQVN